MLEQKITALNIPASEYINRSSLDFSIYVCKKRGIPSLMDGLKDGQRKALYLLKPKSGEIKTVSLAGEMISSELYIHGDTGASESIGMLAAPYLNNIPFIQGVGNFGTKAKAREISAARYTYVASNKVTRNLMYVDIDVAPMEPNSEGTNESVEYFLPLIPTILFNGISGMGVGFKSAIFPRDPLCVAKATLLHLQGKPIPDELLMPSYQYCSDGHSTKGKKPHQYYFVGKGEVVDTSTVRITDLPPDVTPEKFKEKLVAMLESKKIREYTNDTAESVSFTVKLPRGMAKDWTSDNIIKFFGLRKTQTEILTAICDDRVKIFSSAQHIVEEFVARREPFFYARYEKLIGDLDVRLAWLYLYHECFKRNLADRISSTKSRAALIDEIRNIRDDAGIKATDDQLSSIAELPSYRWTEEALEKCKQQIDELITTRAEYEEIRSTPQNIRKQYIKEVRELIKMIPSLPTGRE